MPAPSHACRHPLHHGVGRRTGTCPCLLPRTPSIRGVAGVLASARARRHSHPASAGVVACRRLLVPTTTHPKQHGLRQCAGARLCPPPPVPSIWGCRGPSPASGGAAVAAMQPASVTPSRATCTQSGGRRASASRCPPYPQPKARCGGSGCDPATSRRQPPPAVRVGHTHWAWGASRWGAAHARVRCGEKVHSQGSGSAWTTGRASGGGRAPG